MTQNSDSQQYKVSRSQTRHGQDGQHHLVAGQGSSMRLWHNEQPSDTADKQPHANDYETLGYVVSGSVELELRGRQLLRAQRGAAHLPRHGNSDCRGGHDAGPGELTLRQQEKRVGLHSPLRECGPAWIRGSALPAASSEIQAGRGRIAAQ